MAGWREVLAMTIKKKAIYKNMVSSESPGHTVGFFSPSVNMDWFIVSTHIHLRITDVYQMIANR